MITKTTTIRGTISGADDLSIDGKVEGSIRLDGALTVNAEAQLKADIDASSITLHGSIEGRVQSESTFVLTEGASVVGTITTKRLSVAEGAKVQGRVEMDFDL